MKRAETVSTGLGLILPGEERKASSRGLGLDESVLDEAGWDCVVECCEKYGIDQQRLSRIFRRYRVSMLASEHADFTQKQRGYISVDFLVQDLSVGPAELTAQMLVQTRFLGYHPDLAHSQIPDRRQLDFSRLLLIGCEIASLSLLDAVCHYWLSAIGRTGDIIGWKVTSQELPPLQLREELAREILGTMHVNDSPAQDLLIDFCINFAKGDDLAREGFVTLRRILIFSVRHPPLVAPILACQSALRRRLGGLNFWRRKVILRKPDGCSKKITAIWESMGLSQTHYSRVLELASNGNSHASGWMIAMGHVLLEALFEERNESESESKRILEAPASTRAIHELIERCLSLHADQELREKTEGHSMGVIGSKTAECLLHCGSKEKCAILCQTCSSAARCAAMQKFSIRRIHVMLRQCGGDGRKLWMVKQDQNSSGGQEAAAPTGSLSWEEMRDPLTGELFWHSVQVGKSLWSSQVETGTLVKRSVGETAKPVSRVDVHRCIINPYRVLKPPQVA